MTIHRDHPIDGDPDDAILYDNCDRCTEHAMQLTSLDSSNARQLVSRVIGVERWQSVDRYRSHAEAEAGRRVFRAAVLIASARGVDWTEVLS